MKDTTVKMKFTTIKNERYYSKMKDTTVKNERYYSKK